MGSPKRFPTEWIQGYLLHVGSTPRRRIESLSKGRVPIIRRHRRCLQPSGHVLPLRRASTLQKWAQPARQVGLGSGQAPEAAAKCESRVPRYQPDGSAPALDSSYLAEMNPQLPRANCWWGDGKRRRLGELVRATPPNVSGPSRRCLSMDAIRGASFRLGEAT